MKQAWLALALLGLGAGVGLQNAKAAERPAVAPTASSQSAQDDKVTNGYDLKPEAVLDLQQLQKKYTDLANAIPQEKFTWRPGDGVRSVSEVFLHISQANYYFCAMIGGTPPAEMSGKDFEKSTTDKAKIVDQLNKSFEFAQATVNKMTNADLAKALPKLGKDANEGDVVYLMLTHAHEHLGQSIAYARVNGVVPPWTAAAAAAAAAKDGQKPQD
jgi:uncharacterized damage-inducible protein DinB